ncbi:hypothetical protein K1T71_007238 [Dendrolimus kikuchii]|uniref:Uncharacterized protein n=1 Tax=Dendrolimus kikuchii TaxID=765133 RepID=A0ACC1CZW0_9NEOP|nr:hypothetical protein K1T71_007238 [Dendrolimus kikuchii]
MSYTRSTYEYTKLRKNFGRQPLFQAGPGAILDSIYPNKVDQEQYILRNPIHREVQATMPQSENYSNTKQITVHDAGINHTEGGWPREVHMYNEDHTLRHRRRIMHDDNYVHALKNLAPMMEHYVDQNNAIEMYQAYFDEFGPQHPVENYNVRISNTFHDQFQRPISSIVWINEKSSKLVAAYCNKHYYFEGKEDVSNECYMWDTCKPSKPVNTLNPKKSCWQLACSPVSSDLITAGLSNGVVNLFDVRKGKNAVSSSSIYNSHREPITALLYTHSRTNTEFFTGSCDGQCLWWDLRNFKKPLSTLPMSIKNQTSEEPNLGNAESISTLEFDHGLPTKFLCGTDSGYVISVNRMGRCHSEILSSFWTAHSGPVRAVHRSPCTLRMFLTCGDWSVRVWSEEVRTAPIIVTRPYRYEVTDAVWVPTRFSSYMVICAGGLFYYWDFLRSYKKPILTLQVSKYGLTKISPHTEDQLLAVGDNNGSMFLLQPSDTLSDPRIYDKNLMSQTYQRETRREHILDNRLKEIRLKAKVEEELIVSEQTRDILDEEQITVKSEMDYFNIIKEELHEMEGIPSVYSLS